MRTPLSILSLTLLSFLFAVETFATHVSHDWSFRVGGTDWQSLGLWGVEEASGAHAETWVFYGSGHFTVPVHIYAFTAIANIPLLALVAFFLWRRYRHRHANAA